MRRWYLSSIGQHELLEVGDEKLLAMDVQELQRWRGVRSSLERRLARPPSKDEWSEAVGFDEARTDSLSSDLMKGLCFDKQLRSLESAKETMINSNLRLVVSIAKRYANRGLGLQDLIQEGTLGLITAVDKFDPAHASQAKFSSYASWWIKQRVRRAVGQSRTIKLPSRMPSLIYSAQRAKEEFVLEIGREPTHAELASSLGISDDRLHVVQSASLQPVSLDCELKGHSRSGTSSDQRTLADMLPDATTLCPEEELEGRMVRQTLARSLHPHLKADEHSVICACYNLIEDRKCARTDQPNTTRDSTRCCVPSLTVTASSVPRAAPLTYAEIGARWGKSSAWVEKVEARALKKLKGRPQLRNLLTTRDLSIDGYEGA